ncbi:prestalk protein-like isoform X2 [Erpetoichthys calabaricus]|uniref:prestalk protein-like isoform X2 n=1 Tax=Erpetoichthys calabaricus TaxID=27687 RepID=UPI0022347D6D|nr:prestalk protein-like isoform X2 [Erpetoichthys calabaricus]
MSPQTCNVNSSVNYGYGNTVWISQCCNTSLCNNENVNTSMDANGLVCCAGANGICANVINCTGIQDHCFTAGNGMNTFLGCSSIEVCENPAKANLITGIFLPSQMNCCQGSLCNEPNTTYSPVTCYGCSSSVSWDACANTTMVCPASTPMCAAMLTYSSGAFFYQRTCAAPASCNVNASVSYGYGNQVWISECCTTDLCNTNNVNVSTDPNGLVCCTGSDASCLNTVNCTGPQDSCFSLDDLLGGTSYRGCASQSICDNQYSASLLPVSTSQISCCQGSLCNKPNVTLTCNSCSSNSWSSCVSRPVSCSPQYPVCGTYLESFPFNGNAMNVFHRQCSSIDQCNMTISYDVGYGSSVFISQCCSSNLCNTENITLLSDLNGLSCCTGNNGSCQSIMNCIGTLDHCFTYKTGYSVISGCASQSFCDTLQNGTSCCQGSLCNQPNQTSSLSCYECLTTNSWSSCDGLQPPSSCPLASMQCGAAAVQTVQGSFNQTQHIRSCMDPANCNILMSVSTGEFSAVSNSVCCSSDLCNNQTIEAVNQTSTNGLQCYGGTNNTQNVLLCQGIEDHCFTVGVQGLGVVRGCASSSACFNMNTVAAYLGIATTSDASCCQGAFCNSATYNFNLRCYDCQFSTSWESCGTNIKSCSSVNATCATILNVYTSDFAIFSVFKRSCETPDRCNISESTNYGRGSNVWTTQCCTTDLCNAGAVNTSSIPNGLTCCASTDGSCQTTVACTGIEDHCFSSVLGTNIYMGCTSQSICSNPANSLTIQQFTFISGITCCQGNYCNNQNPLICNQCNSTSWETCGNDTIVCALDQQYCLSALNLVESASINTTTYLRSCGSAVDCNRNMSFNSGNQSQMWISECCTTNLCNTQQVQANVSSSLNGLVCCGGTDAVCNKMVECTGDQTFCFTSGAALSGCVTADLCSLPGYLCCQGNLCNTPANYSELAFCYHCYSNSSWQTCESSALWCGSPSSKCATGLEVQTLGFTSSYAYQRFCAPQDSCNVSFSINSGNETKTTITQCCESSLCNTETVGLSSDPNGLVCCAGADGSCQNTVNCTGLQDQCFTAGDAGVDLRGCASGSICLNPTNASQALQMNLSAQMACCVGNLCNRPISSLVCPSCFSDNLNNCQDSFDVCSSQHTTCTTVFGQDILGGSSHNYIQQYCTIPDSCNETTSINFGQGSIVRTTECCDTDFCYASAIPGNVSLPINELTCCAGTDGTCRSQDQCAGVEDHCFTAPYSASLIYMGCCSSYFCQNIRFNCCQGSLCNNPESGPVTNLTAENVTSTSFTLRWTLTKYNVAIARVKLFEATGVFVSDVTVYSEVFVVSGLTPGSNYTVQVSTVDGNSSTIASAASLTVFTKPAPVISLNATAVTSTSTFLTWTLASGTASSFSIVIEGNPNSMSVNTTFVNVTGLLPLSPYTIWISAVSGDGTEGDAASISIFTSGVSLRYQVVLLTSAGLDLNTKTLVVQQVSTLLHGYLNESSFSASWKDE